jgi:hypothetical protein
LLQQLEEAQRQLRAQEENYLTQQVPAGSAVEATAGSAGRSRAALPAADRNAG